STPWAVLWTFVFPLGLFFTILKITKFVSLSSMISVSVAAILMFIVQDRMVVSGFAAAIAILVIYRHRANIKRLLAGKESKVKWL
ncbi:MAG: hypothetical protein E4G74_03520, partial [Erysipelotrichales bacterium]